MSTSKQNKTSPEIRKTKAYYEKRAGEWTSAKTNSFHHEAAFIKFSSLLKPKDSVIDIGCAGGIHVPLFLGIGRHLTYIGLDIAKAFLKIARRRYPQLSFVEGNIADKQSLPHKRFDGFLAAAVLMHIPYSEWDTAFSNLESILKLGAYDYLALPTKHPSGDRASHDPRHFTILDEADQLRYMKNRGWKIIRKITLDGSTQQQIWKGYIVKMPT